MVFALLLLAAIPAAAAEKWYEAYTRGVQAINAKNYSAAAEALQRSISEMPTESNAARTRRDTIVYVPHFWLGIAKFNLGDVDGALREFRSSEDQGVIQNTDYYARMREWIGRAQAEKQRSAQTAVAEPRKAADAAVSRAMSTQMDALAVGGDRGDTYRAGKQKLSEAVDQFNNAGTDARAYHRAGDIANQARDLFASAAEAAKRAKAARPVAQPTRQQPRPAPPPVEVTRVQVETQRPAEVPKQVPAPVAAAPKLQQAPQPQPAVEDAALVAARVALQEFRGRLATAGDQRRGDEPYQRALRAAVREAANFDRRLQKSHDPATISSTVRFVTERQRELDTITVTATAASATPASDRGGLESAYRAFARGDFDSADQQLTNLLGTRALAEGFLLRGCTRFTRATLSRSPKPGLDAAAEDFRAALKLNRDLRLQKSAFSPKLVAYFESVRASAVR
jgi:tetratricopeptide (TPR) repeat protein